MNCPHCNRPLKEIFAAEGKRKEYICDVALKGLMAGKIGPGYRHDKVWVYVVK